MPAKTLESALGKAEKAEARRILREWINENLHEIIVKDANEAAKQVLEELRPEIETEIRKVLRKKIPDIAKTMVESLHTYEIEEF